MSAPAAPPSPWRDRLPFAALSVVFAAWAAAFVWRTSATIGGERVFVLFDDAMISMRYARNLAAGHGLVWDAGGARVEGITNPLWTGWMALLHLLPVAETRVSLWVQLTSLLLLVANLWVVRAVALRVSGGSRPAALGACVLTAAYLPLNNWALQGMEVGLLALLVSAAVLLALRALDRGAAPAGLYLLLGVATWVRIDMAVPFLAIAGFLALADRPNRRRHVLLAALSLAFFLGAQTLLRAWYFGDLLPNTYHLKMTGYPVLLRWTRGAEVLAVALWNANPLLVLLPAGLLLFRRDRVVLLLWAVVAGQAAYSVYVGGDAWEWWGGANRYVSLAAPLFFVLLAVSLRGLVEHARARMAAVSALPPPLARGIGAVAWPALLLLAVASLNSLKGPRSLGEWLLVQRPMHAADNADFAEMGMRLRAMTAPEARVAVRAAGAVSYFADRRMVDLLGKVDRRIARGPMVGPPPGLARFVGFYPGHLKWDYAWSVGTLRPDVVVWQGDPPPDLAPWLRAYEPHPWRAYTVWTRRASPRVCRPAEALSASLPGGAGCGPA